MSGERRLAAIWETFRAVAVPINASTDQVIDTQNAFYAGALATFGILFADGIDMQRVEDLHQELGDYRQVLVARAAGEL
jgi:hypothetical protein